MILCRFPPRQSHEIRKRSDLLRINGIVEENVDDYLSAQAVLYRLIPLLLHRKKSRPLPSELSIMLTQMVTRARQRLIECMHAAHAHPEVIEPYLDRPAVLGEIDGIAVRIMDAVFRLAVGWSLVNTGCGVEFIARIAKSGDIFHFETEVVQSGLQVRPLNFALGLDGYDREVNVPIGKIGCRTDAINYLQPEGISIKLNQLVYVFRENGEMPNACHSLSSSVFMGESYAASVNGNKYTIRFLCG